MLFAHFLFLSKMKLGAGDRSTQENFKIVWKHGPIVIHAYVENKAILEDILLYRASEYKQIGNLGC